MVGASELERRNSARRKHAEKLSRSPGKRRLAYHKMLRTAQRQCACKPIIAVGMDMRNSRRDNCRFRGVREIADFLYLNACVCGVAAIVNWLGLETFLRPCFIVENCWKRRSSRKWIIANAFMCSCLRQFCHSLALPRGEYRRSSPCSTA